MEIIQKAGATPCGVAIALDRQERGLGALSAVQEVEQKNNLPVISIAGLADLIRYLDNASTLIEFKPAIEAYRAEYGVAV